MKKGFFFALVFFLGVMGIVGLIKGYKVYKRFSGIVSSRYKEDESAREKGVITNIVLKNTENGEVVWVLKAAKGKLEGKTIMLEDVEIVYRGGRTGELVVRADRGRIDKEKDRGILEGNVVLRLKNGILKAKRVVWRAKLDEVCVPDSFVFSGKYNIWGRNLCLYPKKEVIKVYNLKKVVIQ